MSHAPQPDAEGLAEPLRSRWSPSIFDDTHELTRREVVTLLHAAQWAPSLGNSQPWGFVVAPRGSAAHRALVAHLSRGNAGWVPRASLVLVGGTRVATDPDGADAEVVKDADFARYDLGQAAAHVTLQARAMGLHAHQFAGFDHPAAAAALGVPGHVQLMAGIAIGVRGDAHAVPEPDRDREQRPRRRKPLAAIAFGATWGEAWTG
ncbi:nitroreductase family protein [soil metagenome]